MPPQPLDTRDMAAPPAKSRTTLRVSSVTANPLNPTASADNLCGELEGMTDSLETACSKTRGACTGRAWGSY
ncbi:hypothetical protein K474DRAFT_1660076 [Panus rudis PR-1116 ss-1]|nr:hypothetical protein K474DRAFT_1660076 [Panus rudis PR-1116 ss-1]